jgi:predicted DNA-binding protein (MmcQ/YjbR family)
MAQYVVDSTDVNPNGMEEVIGSIPIRSTNHFNKLDGPSWYWRFSLSRFAKKTFAVLPAWPAMLDCTMKHALLEDSRVKRLTTVCLRLTGTTREITGDHVTFYVRKKVFAYFLDNHHGDGIVGLVCKVLPGDNVRLIASNPAKFYMPAYVGPRGWVGLRLDRGKVAWKEVDELVSHSYQLVAPKRLAATADIDSGA